MKRPCATPACCRPEGSTIRRTDSHLSPRNRLGMLACRLSNRFRMHYRVDPGLYTLGKPGQDDPVFVTANYKMSFDALRSALPGREGWILVLDTNGINVWCAAGKGTFGTTELVERIKSSGLERVVSHRELILPQLAGPGVAAHQVKKLSGFKVIYGPIRAKDLPAFLKAGKKATPEMRRKSFTLGERIVLIPVELVEALKSALIVLPILFLIGGLGGPNGFWANTMNYGLFAVLAVLTALLTGTILAQILLPWLPGRAFSLKGFALGLVVAGIVSFIRGPGVGGWPGWLEILAWLLLIPSIVSYFTMNFTGASTYTSLSGVKKEMRWAVPLQIAASVSGSVLWLASRFMS